MHKIKYWMINIVETSQLSLLWYFLNDTKYNKPRQNRSNIKVMLSVLLLLKCAKCFCRNKL